MSAISGIWHWDARPVADETMAALGKASRLAGPHAHGAVRPMMGLAMQAHLLHFDQHSVLERQPRVLPDGTVLTWDGRLDNREDLLVRLWRELGSDQGDAAIVGAAYARWGVDSLSQLVGDWSVAIWDAKHERLVLARDYMGNRPLYYIERPHLFAWATSLEALIDAFDLASQPDDAYITGKLTFGVPLDVTPFRGVRRLFAGHQLLATRYSIQAARYWFFSPARLQYSRPDDYSDRMRELLTEAVKVRLRSNRTVWSHMSGGFDSSSIVLLAHRLIANGHVEARRLQPITMVGTRDAEYDEMKYVDAVLRACEMTTIQRNYMKFRSFEELLTLRQPLGFRPFGELEEPVVAAGDHIVLSGLIGDEVMLNGRFQRAQLLDYVQQGHPLLFLRQTALYARVRQRSLGTALLEIFQHAFNPALPRMYRTSTYKNKRPLALARTFGVTESTLLRAPDPRSSNPPPLSPFPRFVRPLVAALYSWGVQGDLANRDECPTLLWTFPYSHRPLVEFMLGAPPLAIWDPTGPRVAMKRALAELLPPELLARRSKGAMSTVYHRRQEDLNASFLAPASTIGPADQWQLVKRGYLERAAVADALATLHTTERAYLRYFQVWLVVEGWLRALEIPRRESDGAFADSASADPLRLATL